MSCRSRIGTRTFRTEVLTRSPPFSRYFAIPNQRVPHPLPATVLLWLKCDAIDTCNVETGPALNFLLDPLPSVASH
jgi:hypothetical protein